MKRILFFICILILSNIAKSQTKAFTENGYEVLLFDNGTWQYLNDSNSNKAVLIDSLIINPKIFNKTKGTNYLIKSKIFNIGVFVNPNKWTYNIHTENEKNPEFKFRQKSGEAFVMMTTEKTQVELEIMRTIALKNIRKVDIYARELSAEYRIVNKNKVLCLKFQATIDHINFIFLGYYYSNSNGTVQLVCSITKKYFENDEKEIEEFLNGFVEIKKQE